MTTSTVQQNLQDVRQKISAAAERCGRAPGEITLLAVSKTKPVTAIEDAIAAGQRAFGENYVQEGVEKILYFRQTHQDIALEWHFIGPLQSNKSRPVAEHFDWCHTIDRLRIAQRLSEQRPDTLPPLNVLLQINISREESKSGILPDELPALAASVAALPNLRLRGLMAIPAPEADHQRQLAVFRRMYDLFQQLQADHAHVDTLSMGMTDDMAAAIEAGSTLVRIGTAIFGARDYGATARNA
ncbi:YggS family pyridoxal phosphate-dependent enzyme [Musicola keenii]|uniref:YggS family pyridoxal phosphate-dependent enzyme n=1 Tax=Musicola keenii TaxID=2884250 RepID=UPI0017850E2A|nr:YggS family pyridoxal phosphate-dependent enzyme [Musicola keenii]